MSEDAGLDIGVDVKISAQTVEQAKSRVGKRSVELDLEGGRAQDHATNSWRIVVRPSRRQNAAYTLADDGNALKRDAVGGRNMADESVKIFYKHSKTVRVVDGRC